MCGRFTLKTAPDQWGQLLLPSFDSTPLDLSELDTPELDPWHPRYNIAPTQPIVGLVRSDVHGARKTKSSSTSNSDDTARPTIQAHYYRWGLVPFWADDLAIGNRMINARSETLAEKPAFRKALAEQRCVVIADGYYEWQALGKRKQPFWIHRDDQQPFAFAGLWDRNRKATNQEVLSATIITAPAAEHLADLHDRMPAIFSGEAIAQWLDPNTSADQALQLIQTHRETDLQADPVSTHVNNPRHEDPECLQ